MKILISNDGPTAFLYIRTGLARAFSAANHEVVLWDIHKKPAYDMFDEFEPDLFIGQTYNTTPSICKIIKERPHMKVIMKGADWGPLTDTIPHEFPIVRASKLEKHSILDLYNETGKPDYIYIHYYPDYIDGTHGGWINAGIPVHQNMLASDIFDYTNGKSMDVFKSDITFVGGYWPYKGNNIDRYLMPLCEDFTYKIKIFGNNSWPVPQYCGFAPNDKVKHILASATVCPQLHEPHSTEYGFDITERTFKLLSNKCFMISDYVEGFNKLFGDSIVMVKTPQEFKEKIDYFLANPDERLSYIEQGYNKVMNNHTYFHRAQDIFQNLGFSEYANELILVYENLRSEIE